MKYTRKKAFTLIELLISASLGIIFLSSVFFAFNVIMKNLDVFRCSASEGNSIVFPMSRISEDIKCAASINPSSDTAILSLVLDGRTISYGFKNGKIFRAVDSHLSYMTDNEDVGSLSFTYPNTGLVRITAVTGDRLFTLESFSRNIQ